MRFTIMEVLGCKCAVGIPRVVCVVKSSAFGICSSIFLQDFDAFPDRNLRGFYISVNFNKTDI
jgi:hypothetical protein